MDGVLTDFDTTASEILRVPTKEFQSWDEDKFWKKLNPYVKYGLFRELPWMKNGKQLWDYIKQYYPIILTAVPRMKEYPAADKRIWVSKNLGENVKVITVVGGQNKAKAVNPWGNILIDDKMKCLIPWTKKGGISFYYKNENITEIIKLLKRINI
jgi:hypothetical protein